MEIFKLKTELDSSQATNTSLKETIIIKENNIRILHERITDVNLIFENLFLFTWILFYYLSRKQKWLI